MATRESIIRIIRKTRVKEQLVAVAPGWVSRKVGPWSGLVNSRYDSDPEWATLAWQDKRREGPFSKIPAVLGFALRVSPRTIFKGRTPAFTAYNTFKVRVESERGSERWVKVCGYELDVHAAKAALLYENSKAKLRARMAELAAMGESGSGSGVSGDDEESSDDEENLKQDRNKQAEEEDGS